MRRSASLEDKAAYLRDWRAKNPGKQGDYKRAWKAKHPRARLLARAKENARARGMNFDLSIEDIFIPDVCPITLQPLSFEGPKEHRPSIDRIRNHLGYVKGNVLIVSERANRIKQDASIDEIRRMAAVYGWFSDE